MNNYMNNKPNRNEARIKHSQICRKIQSPEYITSGHFDMKLGTRVKFLYIHIIHKCF